MRRKIIFIFTLGLLLLFSIEVHSEKPSDIQFSRFVVDNPKLLSIKDFQELNSLLKQIENETTNQIFIAIINTLDGQKIEEFASELYSSARPGLSIKNNGVLIILAMKERRIRISLGYGLENVITDVYVSFIINNHIMPHFKNGDFKSGIFEAVSVIKEELYKPDIKHYFSMKWNIPNLEEFVIKYPESIQKCDAFLFLGRFYEDLWNDASIRVLAEDKRKKSVEYYEQYLSDCTDGIWEKVVEYELSLVKNKKPDSHRYLAD